MPVYFVSAGNSIRYYDANSLLMQKEIRCKTEAKSISFSSDRAKFCVVYSDATEVGVFDVNVTDDKAVQLPVPQTLCASFMNRKNTELAIGTKSGSTLLWDLTNARAVKTYSNISPVLCVKSNYNDAYLACGYGNGNILLHHLETNNISKPLTFSEIKSVVTMDFSLRDRNILASGSCGGSVYIWDIYAYKNRARFSGCHVSSVSDVCFSPVNAMALASGGYDTKVNLFDVKQARVAMSWKCSEGVSSLCFYPDGNKLLVGGIKGAIEQWDLRKDNAPIAVTKQPHRVNCLRFNIHMKLKESCKKIEKTMGSEAISDIPSSAAASDLSDHPANTRYSKNLQRFSIESMLSPPVQRSDTTASSSFPTRPLPNVSEEQSSTSAADPMRLLDDSSTVASSQRLFNDSSSLFSMYEREKLEKLGHTTSVVNERSLSPSRRPLSTGNATMEEVQELLQAQQQRSSSRTEERTWSSPARSCDGSPSRIIEQRMASLGLVQRLFAETANEQTRPVKENIDKARKNSRLNLRCLSETIFNQALENEATLMHLRNKMLVRNMQLQEEIDRLEEENSQLRELAN